MRSLLFVPGHRARMIEKALSLEGLDVALLDLEDGVPAAEKEHARRLLAEALRGRCATIRYVRSNRVGSDLFSADVAAVAGASPDGLVLPKVVSANEVLAAARELDDREREAGIPPGSIRLMPSIESARGLLAAHEIAACSPRVSALLFGAEDFANDLGLPTDREGEAAELLHARSAVVVASAAARVLALDGIWPNFEDADGLRRDAVLGRRLGFAGKSCIHPAQVPVIDAVFSPTPDEMALARKVVASYEAALAEGRSATSLAGELIDPPIVERARRTIATHERIAAARS